MLDSPLAGELTGEQLESFRYRRWKTGIRVLISFFFFLRIKFIYFNWRLINVGFAMHRHQSATGIHVSPIPNPVFSCGPFFLSLY